LADDKSEEAIRYAHTLKGVAGTIGATALQRVSAKLESDLKSGSDVEELLGETKTELDHVLETLESNIGRDVEADATESGNGNLPDNLGERLDALKEMLEDYDTEAEALLDEILDDVHGTEIATPLSDLGKRVGNYDFEGAVTELAELRARIGI
jgi:HPt (histidine-containing phosphotransfer) domain-containing protein